MKNIVFLLSLLIVNLFCAQESLEKFEQNGKIGLKYQNKIVLPPVYDMISTNILIITSKANEKNIYDQKLSLLYKNTDFLTTYYSEDFDILQIILKDGSMKNYTWDGILNDYSKFIPKKESTESYRESRDRGSKTYIIEKKVIKEELNNILSNPEDELIHVKYIINGKDAVFLNNEKKLEIEYTQKRKGNFNDKIIDYGYSEEFLFRPLKIEYIISKQGSNYGVWDFKERKMILPFEYKRIISYQNYLNLEKNGLYTYYPNIGTEPKYKKLEPYIGYFARFETPDGKKGWVNRKGKEYFDQ
ncbi:hypothetical protein [Chryseobacterium sp. W4I1]|uniref:hypothetical protein n=1 Tax=Chryseobacterium sp. W4I1 TaxID=3042293 RepID=UPI00278483F0|nr:hypothetical protein [Chryseobacterium sp. W4I1]MDQ0784052.1 hypothetical protein [Chryseobacterium sp. W4I1]